MPASLTDLLHTLGQNVVFRTEQEFRDFHDGVDALNAPADGEDVPADQGVADEKPTPKTVAAKAGVKS